MSIVAVPGEQSLLQLQRAFGSGVPTAAQRRRSSASASDLQSPEPTSVEAERAIAAKATSTYSGDSAMLDQTARATPEKDYMTVADCNGHTQSNQPDGWYKNHWSWCQQLTFFLTLHGKSGTVYGRASFQSMEIGRGYAGSRHITVAQYISEVVFTGSWSGTTVNFDMDCRGLPSAKHCQITRGGESHYISDGTKLTVHHRMDSTATSSKGRDKESVGIFTPRISTPGGDNIEHGFANGFRCDSATYLGSSGACIFDRVIGTFQLDRRDSAVNEEAKHAYSAIHGSKHAPFKLTRMYSSKKQAANHRRALRACKAAHPTRPAGKDCDEYPFKSTHQGAAYAHGHFSAKYIDSGDNRRAGARLGAWFKADRILDGDRFNVAVK